MSETPADRPAPPGARPAAAAKPAASSPKPAASGKPAAAPAKSEPAVKPEAAAKPAAAAAKPAARRPAAARAGAKGGAAKVTRREFPFLAIAWGVFTGAMALGLTAVGRFLFPNVLTEPPSTFKAGFPEDFAIGVVDTRFKERYQVWIVRDEEKIYALSTICTHLGCTPNWLEAEAKFKCPCHGSGFYASGINFEGPAPRPLERVGVSLAEDGQLLIDKARLFKFEAGQWEDSASFLPLV